MCSSGKVGYSHPESAQAAARSMNAIYREQFNLYDCAECGKVHVGTHVGGKARRHGYRRQTRHSNR